MSKNRHTALAYLLLAVTLLLLLNFFAMPVVSNLSSQYKANRVLQNELLAIQHQLTKTEQTKASVKLETQAMIDKGRLVYAAKASDAGHQLQVLLKSLMQIHSVNIRQLRPSNEILSEGLSKSRLELSFELPIESLNGVLTSLSESRPRLDIELISLRGNKKYLSNTKNRLEVSLHVAMWYTSGALFATSDDLDLSVNVNHSSTIDAQANILAGLFDANVRSRFSSPSPAHYRLAALNISQNSRIAIIANSDDGKIRRLEPGDMLDDWQVETVTSSGVSLKIGERRETLSLLP
jgi:hypothetical protein